MKKQITPSEKRSLTSKMSNPYSAYHLITFVLGIILVATVATMMFLSRSSLNLMLVVIAAVVVGLVINKDLDKGLIAQSLSLVLRTTKSLFTKRSHVVAL